MVLQTVQLLAGTIMSRGPCKLLWVQYSTASGVVGSNTPSLTSSGCNPVFENKAAMIALKKGYI
jgi:hypothetical protein